MVVLFDILLDDTLQVLGVVEERLDVLQDVLHLVEALLAVLTCRSLDTADAGSHAALRENLEEPDAACRAGVDTTTELARRSEANHTYLVAVLLAEQGNGAQFLGFVEGHVAMFVNMDVLTDHVVHHALYLSQLLVADLLEVGEVETQCVGRYERAFLLHMVAQNLLQGIVQQVGGSMVGCRGISLVSVDAGHEFCRWVLGQLLDDVYALVVLALGVDDVDGFVLVAEHTAVAYLTTHLTIERRGVEHELVELVLLLGHLAVTQDVTVVLRIVIAYKLLFALNQFCPVAVLDSSGIAGTLFLFLHLHIELLLVHTEAVLTANQLSQVEGESVGVEQTESLNAVQLCLALCLQLAHGFVYHRDTLVQRTQERILLFLDDLRDELLLSLQLGEGIAHLVHQCGNELIEESVFLSEEGVGIAYGTTQDAADDVAGLGVRGQLAVGNREGYGTQVVGTHTHGDVDVVLLLVDGVLGLFLKGRVFQSGDVLLGLDDGLEDIGIVVRVLALHHAYQALEAHTRINDVHRQRFQRTVSLAVELHEYDVPDLYDLWVVLVHQFAACLAGSLTLLRSTRVDVDLRAGTARTRVAHLPEVVVLVTVNDVVLGHMLGPVFGCLVVAWDILFGRTFEHGDVEVLRVQLQHVHQILPGHVDGTLLEVVAERPVAQHLEHGVVVRVVSHLLQVVMLTRYAQTLLRVGTASWLRVTGA